MNIVTGFKNTAHITSWQDRDLNQGIFGSGTYILGVGSKLAATIISNNEIHIADGVIMVQGCQGVVQKGTYDTISIDNGTQGMYRYDLICIEYTKVSGTGVESLAWKVVKGTPSSSTPSDPSVTSGDIQNGDSPVQVPIYRVSLNGLTVESVTALVIEKGNVANADDVVYEGTTTIASSSNYGSITNSIISSGTFLYTLNVTANENLPTLDCCIDVENYAFYSGSGSYDSYYGQRTGVTALVAFCSATNLKVSCKQ